MGVSLSSTTIFYFSKIIIKLINQNCINIGTRSLDIIRNRICITFSDVKIVFFEGIVS